MNVIKKSEAIRSGLQKGFRDGTSELARRKCFGYDVGPGEELMINSDEAAIVRWIFDQYLSGSSFTGKELSQYCQEAGFLPVEMRGKHVYAPETLSRAEGAPPHHDPFDRMLIAQAKAENLSFLTHDALLPYYGEPCIIFV